MGSAFCGLMMRKPNMPATYAAPGSLSADDAGDLIRKARKFLRKGLLTHRELALFDCMLWSTRKPGTDTAVASYTTLQRLAHISRETIAKGLRRLGQLGLMEKIKRRVRVVWGGRVASRQATSAYRFRPIATEFGGPTVIPEIKNLSSVIGAMEAVGKSPPNLAVEAAEAARDRVRARDAERRQEAKGH
jgi:hypothetical protein